MARVDLRPIGVVHNGIGNSDDLPKQGVAASIEVFEEFLPGLQGIERSTHIMIIGWLHEADRNALQVHRPRYLSADVKRGVFACRTPVRPNPLGVTTVRLVKVESNVLHVDGLDMTNGTPVVDIKPHAPGFDGVFCARSARDLSRLADPDIDHALRSMLREAENFHGERCAGLVLGARMIYRVMKTFTVAQKDPRVTVHVGEDGCVGDAVQALSGATLGNRRLKWSASPDFVFSFAGRELRFRPGEPAQEQLESLLKADIEDLCDVEESLGEESATCDDRAEPIPGSTVARRLQST